MRISDWSSDVCSSDLDGADAFRPLRGRRLHDAERVGSAPFIMAAPILSYEGLGLVQGSGWLFQDIEIYVGPRDRLALIGRNGAGQTTLLKLLAGPTDADTGTRVILPRPVRNSVAYGKRWSGRVCLVV